MEADFTGSCLCGAVSFQASGKPAVVAQCHCVECRKLSGAGRTVGAMFSWAHVTLMGEVSEYHYTSARGVEVTKAFCPKCSSPIYGTNTLSPGHVTLSLGLIDGGPDLAVEVVIFGRDRPCWDEVGPEVTRYDTQLNWSPDD
jgi:hypothetical protein